MSRKSRHRHAASFDDLEGRLCMASSVGWDGPGRGSATLTYTIGQAPSSLSQETVNNTIKAALGVWSSVANITFRQTSTVNLVRSLDIRFARIDGSGGVLAQAYLPADVNPGRIAGDIEFDSSETWEVGNARGGAAFDLLLTAVHEIGHALGLDHSAAAASVMSDSISPNQSFTALAESDKAEILRVYAPASGTSSTTTPTAATPPTNGSSTNTNTNTGGNTTTPNNRPRRTPRINWNNFFRRWRRISQGITVERTAATA